jgi:hypothetical protein
MRERPRPPPRSPGLFLEYQQGRRLGQGAVLALQLPTQALDLLALGAPLCPLDLARQGGVGLPAGLAPGGQLLREQALAPTVFTQFQFVEAGRFHHRGELLRAAPGPQGGCWGCRCTTLPGGLAAPAVEGIPRDACLAHQLRHPDVVGWQHLRHQAVLQFCRIGSQACCLAQSPGACAAPAGSPPSSRPKDSFPADSRRPLGPRSVMPHPHTNPPKGRRLLS